MLFEQTIIIPPRPHLAHWMKETNSEGKAHRGGPNELSEWACRKALCNFPVGSEQSFGKLLDRACAIQRQLYLLQLHDEGLVDLVWFEEEQVFIWPITERGRAADIERHVQLSGFFLRDR